MTKRPDGGIGRRARLKIWFQQWSAGSIPVLGTVPNLKVPVNTGLQGLFVLPRNQNVTKPSKKLLFYSNFTSKNVPETNILKQDI